MPDEPPAQYRVDGQYADDVTPPQIPGTVVSSIEYGTREEADVGIEGLVGRTDVGEIVLYTRAGANRVSGSGATQVSMVVPGGPPWVRFHTWRRTPGGWRYVP